MRDTLDRCKAEESATDSRRSSASSADIPWLLVISTICLWTWFRTRPFLCESRDVLPPPFTDGCVVVVVVVVGVVVPAAAAAVVSDVVVASFL